MNPTFLIFGYGYTASFLAKHLSKLHFDVIGTSRHPNQSDCLDANDCRLIPFTHDEIKKALTSATHLLITAPPTPSGDPVITQFESLIKEQQHTIKWIGYLSSTGVYGDHQGAWVDEQTVSNSLGERGVLRRNAEKAWLQLGQKYNLPVHVFRLSGIYGPHRNALKELLSGKNHSLYKEGQFFSRIHVEDICTILLKSMEHPNPLSIYNVADDEPSSSHEVIQYAASLLNIPAPPLLPIEKATLSPMAREFYSQNRRVSNVKIKKELLVQLNYPSYREGLTHEVISLTSSE